MAIDKGQDLISSAISFGTVTILEGFGKTYDHFQNKWEAQSIAKVEKLKFAIISMNKRDKGIHIVFSVKNSGAKNINLQEMILLKDEQGLCYPLKISNAEQIEVHPNTTLVSEVEVLLPKAVLASKLVTPTQNLSLGR